MNTKGSTLTGFLACSHQVLASAHEFIPVVALAKDEPTSTASKPSSMSSVGIAFPSIQGYIFHKDVSKGITAAKRIEPRKCKIYVLAVVAELEKTGQLPQGQTAYPKKPCIASDTLSLSWLSHISRKIARISMVTANQIQCTEKNDDSLRRRYAGKASKMPETLKRSFMRAHQKGGRQTLKAK